MTPKKIITLFIILFLLGISVKIARKNKNKYPYKPIQFSETKYPKDNQHAKLILKEDIEDARQCGATDIDITLAKVDLNDDGNDEIFLSAIGGGYNGSLGGLIAIYEVEKNGNWKEIQSWIGYESIGIKSTKHFGYRDLEIAGPNPDPDSKYPLC